MSPRWLPLGAPKGDSALVQMITGSPDAAAGRREIGLLQTCPHQEDGDYRWDVSSALCGRVWCQSWTILEALTSTGPL